MARWKTVDSRGLWRRPGAFCAVEVHRLLPMAPMRFGLYLDIGFGVDRVDSTTYATERGAKSAAGRMLTNADEHLWREAGCPSS